MRHWREHAPQLRCLFSTTLNQVLLPLQRTTSRLSFEQHCTPRLYTLPVVLWQCFSLLKPLLLVKLPRLLITRLHMQVHRPHAILLRRPRRCRSSRRLGRRGLGCCYWRLGSGSGRVFEGDLAARGEVCEEVADEGAGDSEASIGSKYAESHDVDLYFWRGRGGGRGRVLEAAYQVAYGNVIEQGWRGGREEDSQLLHSAANPIRQDRVLTKLVHLALILMQRILVERLAIPHGEEDGVELAQLPNIIRRQLREVDAVLRRRLEGSCGS